VAGICLLPWNLQVAGTTEAEDFYTKSPPGIELRTTTQKPGQDHEELRFQAKGAQTVLPPSRHPSGSLYAWVPGHEPNTIEAAVAPQWLLHQMRLDHSPTNGRSKKATPKIGERIVEGQRDSTLTSIAGTMRRRGLSLEAIEAALKVENQTRCDPPLPEETIAKISRSIGGYPPGDDAFAQNQSDGRSEIHLTDRGNAICLVNRHGRDLRHCHPWRKWLVWDGMRWRFDDTAAVTRRVKDTIVALFSSAVEQVKEIQMQFADDKDNETLKAQLADANRTMNWCLKSEAAPRINAMLDLVRCRTSNSARNSGASIQAF
jgi:hypothetical protein